MREWLRRARRAAVAWWGEHGSSLVRDVVLFGGIGAFSYGASLIYQPAGWIAGGLAVASIGYFGVPSR